MSDALIQKIADKVKAESREPLRSMAGAIAVLRHFLGDEFIARSVRLSKTPDPFMFNDFDENSDNRFVYMQRVCELADYLFILREIEGFDVLLERLLTRETRAPFFEARTASMFRGANFNIRVRRETGIKKEDFDFQAIHKNAVINVEVTACTNARFSVSNLQNVLNAKRKQLPDTAAAALYCILPVSWFAGPFDLPFGLRHVTFNFFSKSRRLNYVVYLWDVMVRLGEGAAGAVVSYPIPNTDARLSPPDLSFIFEEKIQQEDIVRKALRDKDFRPFEHRPSDYSFMKILNAS